MDQLSPMASTSDSVRMASHVFTVGSDRLISPWSNSTQMIVPTTAAVSSIPNTPIDRSVARR